MRTLDDLVGSGNLDEVTLTQEQIARLSHLSQPELNYPAASTASCGRCSSPGPRWTARPRAVYPAASAERRSLPR
ncbi:hypothetical protein ACIRG5_14345 [Lentzea sp. NPDC102401]|uniref:hypothetical protein n=1 Tax=Lentzea sp. NPDC102401 TaxID=3364128 RepID=UPI0037FC11A9